MQPKLVRKMLLSSCALLMIAGCASNRSIAQEAPFVKLSNTSLPSDPPLNEGSPVYRAQLNEASSLLQAGNTTQANTILTQLNNAPLQGTQRNYFLLLQAYYFMSVNAPAASAGKLNAISNPYSLPTNMQPLYYQLGYQAYTRANQPAKSVVSQIKLLQFNSQSMSNDQQLTASSHIWRNLQNLSATDISAYSQSRDPLVQAWFELARTTRAHSNQPAALVNAITNWQQAYPSHPANQILPNSASLNAATSSLNVKQIALLLPLSGPFGQTGQAIRDGFMTAYNAKNAANKPSIRVYDTSSGDVAQLYQQAVSKGANLVIGPLTKDDVSRLISSGNINVPTIALNYTQGSTPPQLIEFGLSPDQAAIQTAQLAWHHGTNRALAMTPSGTWGDNVLQNFSTHFQTEGGRVVDTASFSQTNLQSQVAALLQVQDNSTKHSQTEHYVASLPKPRKDANGVFLAANPVAAREIEPLFRYYLAGNLPVYSMSMVYNGTQDPMSNQDLNGTYFVDLPWMISNDPNIASLRNQAKAKGGVNYTANSRFYGLGVDAFILSQLFNRAVYLPNVGISGVTGRLYLEDKQQVYTQLATAQFVNGLAVMTN